MQAHIARCAHTGRRIDASQPEQRAVLHRIADRLAAGENWVEWRKVAALIAAGVARETSRSKTVTEWCIRSADDPGKRGTHTRAEAYDAEGRKYRTNVPWQRQSAKGNKAHIDRKKRHSVQTIMDRAIRLLGVPMDW